jgi:hypothetical protein
MNLEKKNHEELRVGQSLSVAEVDTWDLRYPFVSCLLNHCCVGQRRNVFVMSAQSCPAQRPAIFGCNVLAGNTNILFIWTTHSEFRYQSSFPLGPSSMWTFNPTTPIHFTTSLYINTHLGPTFIFRHNAAQNMYGKYLIPDDSADLVRSSRMSTATESFRIRKEMWWILRLWNTRSAVGSRYQATASEDRQKCMCAVVTVIFGVCNSVSVS